MAARKSTRARPSPNRPVPSQVIADIIQRLETAQAVITTAAAALAAQAADIDSDVARMLRAHVGGELFEAIERLKAISEETELKSFHVVKTMRR